VLLWWNAFAISDAPLLLCQNKFSTFSDFPTTCRYSCYFGGTHFRCSPFTQGPSYYAKINSQPFQDFPTTCRYSSLVERICHFRCSSYYAKINSQPFQTFPPLAGTRVTLVERICHFRCPQVFPKEKGTCFTKIKKTSIVFFRAVQNFPSHRCKSE